MEISELKTEEEAEWDEYVRNSPASTFYHQIGWKKVLSETYHHRPYYLLAKEDDKISGIFPLFKIKYPFFGEILVSLPYAPFGGICADDEQTRLYLVNYMKNQIAQNHSRSAEVRSLCQLSDIGSVDTSYYSMVLSLQSDLEIQWSGLRKSMRRYIKKAQSAGTESNLDSHNIEGFYELYSRTMQEFGTPPHSEKFFKTIIREFPKNTRIAEVYFQEECIAAIFLLEFNGITIYGWGASDERYASLYPNYLLFWDAIRNSCSRQFRSFDFGRSMLNEGTYLFKTGWGAEPRQLYYYYYPQRSMNTKKTNPKRQVFSTVWTHIPQAITRGLGPVLRKYIP
jgi:serine/alanine adding enzyme